MYYYRNKTTQNNCITIQLTINVLYDYHIIIKDILKINSTLKT